MSAVPTNSKSLHQYGFSSSSLTRATQVSPFTDFVLPKSESTASPSLRAVAARSTRQPRLSFSSFSPASSENDHQKRHKSDEKKEVPPQREEVPVKVKVDEEEAVEEEKKRTWNLRPRKTRGGLKKRSGVGIEPKSNRQKGIPAKSPGLGGVKVPNENNRLWVALSRDEIEEDVFSMSGSRPYRRPRKRPKALQKYLDLLFPGLCLVGMNADSFRESKSPAKGIFVS